jgi:hypothetical protein
MGRNMVKSQVSNDREGSTMRQRKWDFEHIDNGKWPGKGPLYSLLEFNGYKAKNGICEFVSENNVRIIRQRVYEIIVKNKLVEVHVSDVELLREQGRTLRVTQPFWLLSIAYARMLRLTPEQCIFPAGLYSPHVERRAVRGPWRQMREDEVNNASWVTKSARNVISAKRRRCSSADNQNTGIYCFDRNKEGQVDDDIANIGDLIDVELSDKVEALLHKSKPEHGFEAIRL